MTSRRITERIGVGPESLTKLTKKNLDRFDSFMVRSDLELIQELDLPFGEVSKIRLAVSAAAMPDAQTLESLLEREQSRSKLKTGLVLLDTFLQGGISPNCITEIVGAPGIGKTQLCHMLVVNALRNDENSSVLYIDCETAFSASRIQELMQFSNEAEGQDGVLPFPDIKRASERILLHEIKSSADFSALLTNLEALTIQKRINLVILDSIAALVRHEFDSASIFKRQNLLTNWAGTLKAIAERLDIPIIVTNQVTSPALPEGDPYHARTPIAALGTGWYHSVNTRLTLQKCRPNDFDISANLVPAHMKASAPEGCNIPSEGFLRCLGISKSPVSPVVSFPYFITRCGLCLVKRLQFEPNAEQTDDNESTFIHEFEPANYWFNG